MPGVAVVIFPSSNPWFLKAKTSIQKVRKLNLSLCIGSGDVDSSASAASSFALGFIAVSKSRIAS